MGIVGCHQGQARLPGHAKQTLIDSSLLFDPMVLQFQKEITFPKDLGHTQGISLRTLVVFIQQKLSCLGIENDEFKLGVSELEQVVKYIRMQGVPDNYFAINLSIVRGLDYYTGTVYETFLTDYKNIGSVCSGGRYDNLAGFYTEQKLPGVGISIGLTRLFYQLNEKQLIKATRTSVADCLVLPMDDGATEKAYQVAANLRSGGINCQVYLEDKKFKNKMSYADKLAIPYILIIGEDEVKNGVVAVKSMFERSQELVADSEVVQFVKNKLNK